MRTIVGVFDEMKAAEEVVGKLIERGVCERDQIDLLAHEAKAGPSLGPVEGLSGRPTMGKIGAVGGIAGFATGMVALAVPGIGPILAAGPIAAELVGGGVGTVAGIILGRLKQRGVSEQDAGQFCEAVRRGGILVSIAVPDDKAAEAEEIIGQHRLVDIEASAEEWRKQGWTGFRPETPQAAEGKAAPSLPFDPESLRPSVRQERRERSAVRSYVRVR